MLFPKQQFAILPVVPAEVPTVPFSEDDHLLDLTVRQVIIGAVETGQDYCAMEFHRVGKPEAEWLVLAVTNPAHISAIQDFTRTLGKVKTPLRRDLVA